MKDLLEGLDDKRAASKSAESSGVSEFDCTSFSPSPAARPYHRVTPAKLTITAQKDCWVHVPAQPQSVFIPRINPEGQIGLNERRMRTINGQSGLRVSLPQGTTLEKIGSRFFIPANTECSLVDGKVTYPDQPRSREFSGLGLPVTLAAKVEILRTQIRPRTFALV